MEKLLRNLLIGLAILIVLVPLGLLAVGTAFGEWGPEELVAEAGLNAIPAGLRMWLAHGLRPYQIMR